MKVWTVIYSYQFDTGDCGIRCEGMFTSRATAVAKLGELMTEAKKGWSKETEDEYDVESGTYSIWEKGEYCYNHIDIIIFEGEVAINGQAFFKDLANDTIDRLAGYKDNEFPDTTNLNLDDICDHVAERCMEDDEIWQHIDENLEWYVWHHPSIIAAKNRKAGR